MSETPKISRLRANLPWIGLFALLVIVLPVVSFFGNQALDRTKAGVEVRQFAEPRSGGIPYVTAPLFSLPAGEADGIGLASPETSTFEIASPTPDGRGVWVVDHVPGQTGSRLRLYSVRGEQLAEVHTLPHVTLWTPAYDGSIWLDQVDTTTGGETLLHYAASGELLGSYPVPEGVYARSIALEPSGAVWVLVEEWLVDSSTNTAAYGGHLVPIVTADGAAVLGSMQQAVVASFIGADGRFYEVEGEMDASKGGYPTFALIAREGGIESGRYALPEGVRPYAADADGRVYAEPMPYSSADAPGVSTLGDEAEPVQEVVVCSEDGTMSRLPFSYSPGMGGWAATAYPSEDGILFSARWTAEGLTVLTSAPVSEVVPSTTTGSPEMAEARVLVSTGEPYTGDPYAATDDAQRDLWQLVYAGLVSFDASLTAEPDLAVAVPAPGNGVSADGLVVEWRIAEGRTWHDGQSVTADDVVATYRHLQEVTPYARRLPFPGFDLIESVEAEGNVARVTLREPFGAAPEAFFPFVLPAHVLEASAGQANGGLYAAPVGCGPFRVARWEPGLMMLVASGAGPHTAQLGSLDVRFVDNDALQQEYLQSGVPTIATWLLPGTAVGIERDAVGSVVSAPTGRWYGLVMNAKDGVTADADVRKAVLAAHPWYTALTIAGSDPEAFTVTAPFTGAGEGTVVRSLASDPATDVAGTVLRQDGWRDNDGDGVLERSGQPLSLVVSLPSRDSLPHEIDYEVFSEITRRWSSLGARAQWSQSTPDFYESYPNHGHLVTGQHIVAAGVFPGFIDPAWGSVFDPSDTPGWTDPGGMNVSFTDDGVLRELHAAARRSYDPEQRSQLAVRIVERVSELDIALFERPQYRDSAVLGIRGYVPGPYPAGDFWNADEWTAER